MNEMTLEDLKGELRRGTRVILQLRHAERPKMDPRDPTFGDAVAITEEGVRTSLELGRQLGEFREVTSFYASPLLRTRMTAGKIAEGMGIANPVIPTDECLGNGSFYYADPVAVLEVFHPKNFFNACFEYFRTGEQRGFHNLHAASDVLEKWLLAHSTTQFFVAVTHDCYIAAFLSARGAVEEFTRENWTRFLDGGAIMIDPDGTRRYALVRTGLSKGICGVGGRVM